MNAVAGPKNKLKIKALGTVNFWFAGSKYVFKKITGRSNAIKTVVFYPEVTDANVLSDILNRASWYFPKSKFSDVRVYIPIHQNLKDLDTRLLKPPVWQENYINDTIPIELISSDNAKLNSFDAIMLWNKSALLKPGLIRNWHKVFIVDPDYYSDTESGVYRNAYFKTIQLDVKESLLRQSIENYRRLIDKAAGIKKGFIFGTGPSIEKAMEYDFSGGFNVVCNSLVKNRQLLNHIKPQLLTFADPVFHFSPCKYSVEFRKHMLEVVKEFGCYVMVPDYVLPLMLSHYPELEEYIIGMPSKGQNTYNFPTTESFYVNTTGNIMTLFMLPVASALVDQIFIIGSDGRKPDENYFWKHNKTTQFEELMESAFNTHPSFFRDRIYADYYTHHCKALKDMIEYGDKQGKEYYSLTPSYIPVLSERLARR